MPQRLVWLPVEALQIDFVETFAMDPKPSAKIFHLDSVSVGKRPLHYFGLLEEAALRAAARDSCSNFGSLEMPLLPDTQTQNDEKTPWTTFNLAPLATLLPAFGLKFGSPLLPLELQTCKHSSQHPLCRPPSDQDLSD